MATVPTPDIDSDDVNLTSGPVPLPDPNRAAQLKAELLGVTVERDEARRRIAELERQLTQGTDTAKPSVPPVDELSEHVMLARAALDAAIGDAYRKGMVAGAESTAQVAKAPAGEIGRDLAYQCYEVGRHVGEKTMLATIGDYCRQHCPKNTPERSTDKAQSDAYWRGYADGVQDASENENAVDRAMTALGAFAGESLYRDQVDALLSLWTGVGDLDDRQRAEVLSFYPERESAGAAQ